MDPLVNKASIILTEDDITLKQPVSGSSTKDTTIKPDALMSNVLGSLGYADIDSGFIPPGVISIRRRAGQEQFVIVQPPGKYSIYWGPREGSASAKVYGLAFPFQIIIGDFIDGSFLGARMFYSPVMPLNFDTPLYLANVPNYNIRGYHFGSSSEVSVGWLCLYHTQRDQMQSASLAEKASHVVNRVSGSEAYNDANMSSTDGPRYYGSLPNKPKFLSNPTLWEKKTDDEGWKWTLDPDLWEVARVQDKDHQGRHVPDGQILTLDMAIRGTYKAYYQDDNPVKAFNQPTFPWKITMPKLLSNLIRENSKK